MSWCLKTTSAERTAELGKRLGDILRSQSWTVCLMGDLGAGKTTFTKGVACGLELENEIKSPTFVMLKEYDGKHGKLVHVDAYRLAGDFEDIGLEDYFGKANVLIEWADNIKGVLPEESKRIEFEHLNTDERRICFDDSLLEWRDKLSV